MALGFTTSMHVGLTCEMQSGRLRGRGDVLAVTSMRAPAAEESSSSNGKSSEKSEKESSAAEITLNTFAFGYARHGRSEHAVYGTLDKN